MIFRHTHYSGWWRYQQDSITYALRDPRARWIRISPHLCGSHHQGFRIRRRPWAYPMAALLVGGAGYLAYQNHQPFRYTCLAAVRCWRVAGAFLVSCLCDLIHVPKRSGAAILGVIDYKLTFSWDYENENQYIEAVSLCHRRSAKRVLKALLANGGMLNFALLSRFVPICRSQGFSLNLGSIFLHLLCFQGSGLVQ